MRFLKYDMIRGLGIFVNGYLNSNDSDKEHWKFFNIIKESAEIDAMR